MSVRQGLAGLELSLLCQEDGKGQAGSGQGAGHPALRQGYGRENTFRKVLAAAWPWGVGNSHHCR